MPRPRIYLAGDLVFRPQAEAVFARLKTIAARFGLDGVAPFDGQADVKGLAPGFDTIMTIVKADRALMDQCDAGLFCLDPFRRSADMDPGTAVEIGYMFAHGRPLEGYTTDGRSYPDKVAAYWQTAWRVQLRSRQDTGDIGSGALEDGDGVLAHSEGMLQNGMTEGFIRLSGGDVAVAPTLEESFAVAAERLARRLDTI
ncbi:nucleoside 2-deoxyribosyltransferase [Ameyamaea chiangmaiensis NBRC 103196]|uniref:Nucleoside 2-deoxyribosyltransferase n=1 Tax=Ameyamaea chiangmaiensis TaxID=442969 RepID=A0A850PCT8_9PROT|nr:nucleoside 2-deoxyribosyltransferase [Ameyamaea chiangmaiensis]MBS4073579.1 nucleoside 2-deoxyribosyltransferase [Ameyamaea chiangmaiensis]NVN40459.1 nucleoside 2-deoxyribosyltransferase [Ameyamaea chiangmaiensis]GBQ69188.1 nucleoside 2-deoxyribosyltransferase [Ameyamaea chiangmaiensis NBRC 103196]